MNRRITALLVLLMASFFGTSSYAKDGWLTDFEEAKKQAVERGVPIFANFAGSDWCGWCMKLDREVLSKKEFKDFASDKLVLFLADFPQSKKQSKEIKAQNKKLAEEYSVRGFPTVLLLDKEGKKIAQTGYRKGGPAKYVKHIETLLPKK